MGWREIGIKLAQQPQMPQQPKFTPQSFQSAMGGFSNPYSQPQVNQPQQSWQQIGQQAGQQFGQPQQQQQLPVQTLPYDPSKPPQFFRGPYDPSQPGQYQFLQRGGQAQPPQQSSQQSPGFLSNAMSMSSLLPGTLGMPGDIYNAWLMRNPGSEITAGGGPQTPEEQRYLQGVQQKDPNAWRHLPAQYEIANTPTGNANAIEGLLTAAGAIASPGLQLASQIPSWISSWGRWAQGDPREAIYNPEMVKHLLQRQRTIDTSKPLTAKDVGLGGEASWDDARAAGGVLRNFFNRPLQSALSGGKIVYDELKSGIPTAMQDAAQRSASLNERARHAALVRASRASVGLNPYGGPK